MPVEVTLFYSLVKKLIHQIVIKVSPTPALCLSVKVSFIHSVSLKGIAFFV